MYSAVLPSIVGDRLSWCQYNHRQHPSRHFIQILKSVFVLTLAVALLAQKVDSQTFLSLRRHDHPLQCGSKTVPHHVHIDFSSFNNDTQRSLASRPDDLRRPLLIFTSPFSLDTLPEQWPVDFDINNNSTAAARSSLILFNASAFDRSQPDHQRALFWLLRQPHVLCLATTRTKGTTEERVSEIERELSVFEMYTGFIIPFFTFDNIATADAMAMDMNIHNDDDRALSRHLPLFQIHMPSMINNTSDVRVLYDGDALRYLFWKNDNHSATDTDTDVEVETSVKNVTNREDQKNESSLLLSAGAAEIPPPITLSVLDFLNRRQLMCLLARLQCHTIAPCDPVFPLCVEMVSRVPKELFEHDDMIHLKPLSTFKFNHSSSSLPSATEKELQQTCFETKRKQAARAVKLARRGVPEQHIRSLLFHGYYINKSESNTLSTRDSHDDNGVDVQGKERKENMMEWLPFCCRLLSVALLYAAVVETVNNNRRWIKRAIRSRVQGGDLSDQLAKTLEDRAKLT